MTHIKKPSISIHRIEFLNVRGYHAASLHLCNSYYAIVGNNNQGKSSPFIFLDYLINKADDEVLCGHRKYSIEEEELFVPANATCHNARRITLFLRLRSYRGWTQQYKDANGCLPLRLSIKKAERRFQLNVGQPKRGEIYDKRAFELIKRLRKSIVFMLVPAARDANSNWLQGLLLKSIRNKLRMGMQHTTSGGARLPYRQARRARLELQEYSEKQSSTIWSALVEHIPDGLVQTGKIVFHPSVEDVVRWLSSSAQLKLTTGAHDSGMVPFQAVGHGLQNAIGIAVTIHCLANNSTSQQRILAIEEPESFLHPSAQRALSEVIKTFSQGENNKVIISTHSSVFLEETKYEETIIVRDRKYYEPRVVDAQRHDINTALMSAMNAETFFASSVILVEGAGDKALFETLLKRLRKLPSGKRLFNLHVQDTGGVTRFGPWLRLLRCYGVTGDRPIRWYSVLDGDAASGTNGNRAAWECLSSIYMIGANSSQHQALVSLGNLKWDATTERFEAATRLNRTLSSLRMGLFSCDIEWAMVNGGDSAIILPILNRIFRQNGSSEVASLTEAARRLGSKVNTGDKIGQPLKGPHIRMEYAKHIPFSKLPKEIGVMLSNILKKFYGSNIVKNILTEAANNNPSI